MVAGRPLAVLSLLVVGCSSAGGGPGDASGTGGVGGAPAPLAGPCPDNLGIGHFALKPVSSDGLEPRLQPIRGQGDELRRPDEDPRRADAERRVPPAGLAEPPVRTPVPPIGNRLRRDQSVRLPSDRTQRWNSNRHGVDVERLRRAARRANDLQRVDRGLPARVTGRGHRAARDGRRLPALHARGGGARAARLPPPPPTAMVRDNQPYMFTWTPAGTGRSRILAELNIAHEGPIWNQIACDLRHRSRRDPSRHHPRPVRQRRRRLPDARSDPAYRRRDALRNRMRRLRCIDLGRATCPGRNHHLVQLQRPRLQATPNPLPCPVGHFCRRFGTPGGASCD